MNCIFLLLILLCCGNGSGFVCGNGRERDRDDCRKDRREERRGGCGCDNDRREERRGGCDCDNGCREERRGGCDCDNGCREERRGGCDCDNSRRDDCDNGRREERRGGCCGCEEASPFSGFPGQCPNTCGCE